MTSSDKSCVIIELKARLIAFVHNKMAGTKEGIADDALTCKVGFIGGGKMAQAIAKGILAAKILDAANIMASAKTDATLAIWTVSSMIQ